MARRGESFVPLQIADLLPVKAWTDGRFIPAAIVARPWDFDDAPGSQEVTISSAERGGS